MPVATTMTPHHRRAYRWRCAASYPKREGGCLSLLLMATVESRNEHASTHQHAHQRTRPGDTRAKERCGTCALPHGGVPHEHTSAGAAFVPQVPVANKLGGILAGFRRVFSLIEQLNALPSGNWLRGTLKVAKFGLLLLGAIGISGEYRARYKLRRKVWVLRGFHRLKDSRRRLVLGIRDSPGNETFFS